MIRDRIPLFCVKCGGRHLASDCPGKSGPSEAPLETPSHNGPYQGTLPVRVIPPGVFGSDSALDKLRIKGAKGGAKKKRRESPDTYPPCVVCKSRQRTRGPDGRLVAIRKFCSYPCQRKFYHANRDKEKEARRSRLGKAPHRKTKWE